MAEWTLPSSASNTYIDRCKHISRISRKSHSTQVPLARSLSYRLSAVCAPWKRDAAHIPFHARPRARAATKWEDKRRRIQHSLDFASVATFPAPRKSRARSRSAGSVIAILATNLARLATQTRGKPLAKPQPHPQMFKNRICYSALRTLL